MLIFQSLPNGSGYDVLAEATVRRGELRTEGRRQDLVERDRSVYSSRLDRFLALEEDPEEWLRSFAENFRTAQVGALIVKDTAHRELVAPKEVLEQFTVAAHGA